MYKLRTWTKNDIGAGTRVLLRIDANVPLRDGVVTEAGKFGRLEASLPEIRRLLAAGASVVLVTHLGDPAGKAVKKLSVKPLAGWYAKRLERRIAVKTLPELERSNRAQVVMLENVRFFPGEELNDAAFAARLASLADVYVDNAFGVTHRAHASVRAVARLLPSFAGELVVREVGALLGRRKRPTLLILGGAKLSTKLPILNNLDGEVDDVLVGGATCLPLLVAAGLELPSTLKAMPERADVLLARRITKRFGRRLILPRDLVLDETGARVVDVGPETISDFCFAVQGAKSLIWNGPLGIVEEAGGQSSTKKLAACIKRARLSSAVVGGGDSVDYLASQKLLGGFTHVSTGGGAMLALLSGEKLPGLEVLRVK